MMDDQSRNLSRAYPPALRWDTPLHACVVDELFQRACRIAGGTAVFAEDEHAVLTYDRAEALVARVAGGLRAAGVGPGDRVGLRLGNGLPFVVTFLATLRIGAVAVGLSPLDARRQTEAKLRDSGARVLVTERCDSDELAHLRANRIAECVYVVDERRSIDVQAADAGGSSVGFAALLESGTPVDAEPAADRSRVAVLQYTGGTSGDLKAAALSHAALSSCGDVFARWMHRLEPGREASLVMLPLVLSAGLSALFIGSLATASRMVLRRRLDVDRVCDDIVRHGITWLSGVPTLYAGVLGSRQFDAERFRALKYCLCGSAPLPRSLRDEFKRRIGCDFVEGYAMTECVPITVTPTSASYPTGSVGVAAPGVSIRILDVDDPGRVLERGARGQIAVRGPSLMLGYWRRPEVNATAFRDGYLLTGDIGRLDEEGFLFLEDRLKDVIITSGVNVFPARVEEALYEHPGVEEAIVVGRPDEYRGQIVAAFIKPRAGTVLDPAALADFLGSRLGKHELPRAYEFREQLPRTAAGKLSRRGVLAPKGPEA